MGKPRVSLAGLMAFVLLAAVGFAAVKNPSEMLAGVLFLFVVGLLVLALVGVAFRHGNKRLFWAGFGAFGWTYLALALWTEPVSLPVLPTSTLIVYLLRSIYNTQSFTVRFRHEPGVITDINAIRQSLHMLLTLLAACLGSVSVGVFAAREDDPRHSA